MTAAAASVLAAGTVCWRLDHGKLRVLLIRQTGRRDMSFPKGKIDPGESAPAAAVRETTEETGLAISLGVPLGASEYRLPNGRHKVVRYWAAETGKSAIAAARFSPNDEIAEATWLSVASARQKLAFEPDRAVLDTLVSFAERDSLSSFTVTALRHGKAVPAHSWNGPDSTRPLEALGVLQARSSARAIAAFAPQRLISSTAARCMSTIEPVAALTGRDVKATRAISQDAFEDGEADVRGVVAKRLAKGVSAVLCSHGPVLPDILAELADQIGAPQVGRRLGGSLDVGDFVVTHVSRSHPHAGVLATETHTPAMA